ncbi:carbohydrate porin [Vibrio sp. WXL210]|uniref:carbohydrate porin n=1 Tax=Vibrio sp. WXL210 TaxID=3450709 RepID=UPI003EC4F857
MTNAVRFITLPLIIMSASGVASADFNHTLSGDWGGVRSTLNSKGLNFDIEYTNTLQSAVAGSEHSELNNSHRFDMITNLDLEKMGLWEGGKLTSQLVARGGTANDFGYAGLSVPNAGQYGHDEDVFISSLFYTHLFSSSTNLLIGKIDAFELLRNAPFYGGATRHGFLNVAFAAPPSGVTPPSFVGAIANHTIDNIRLSGMIYDPRDRYTNNLDMSGLFKDGMNVSLSATYNTEWLSRSSSISTSFTYSTEEGTDFSSIESIVNGATSQYKYNARIQVNHNLVERDGDSWGIYLRAALADGNPNIIDGTVVGGLGGSALFFDRPMDTWGVGYYYYDLSNDLQDSINDTADMKLLQDESGFEAFYAYQALPWLTLTGDIQYVVPALSTDSAAWVAGLRTNIRF